MARFGTLFIFLLLMLFASVAGACNTCLSFGGGAPYCGWAGGDWCSRYCCNAEWGTSPCPEVDFFDPCYGARASGSFQVALFVNQLPVSQIVPDCRMKGLMQREQGMVPRVDSENIQPRRG